MTTPAPAAPATNGAASKATAPATPPPPTQDVPTGGQTPAQGSAARGPDGKFLSAKPPPPPADDDPEMDFGSIKLKRSAAARELERARNAGRLLQEAERRNKAAEAREKAWEERKSKKDVASILEELGLTPEEERQFLSERMYSRHIAPEQMTPEQRELAEAKAWRAEREAKDKKAAEEAAAAKKAALSDEESKKLHADLIAAAEAGKIPKSRRSIQRIMDKAIAFDSRGMELPLEQVAALVREEVAQDVGEFTDATSIEERKALLGPERFKAEQAKWYAHFKGMLKAAAPAAQPIRAPPQRSINGATKKDTFTPQEFLARLNGRK